MTDKFALVYVNKIKEYCEEHDFCDGCIFKSKQIDCKLMYTPNVWNIEEDKQDGRS